jgi:MinD superfamily P-loop ATPase
MTVAVASGKGGTGKTMVATNLALYLSELHQDKVSFIDADVEEPNAHLFLKPDIIDRRSFGIPVPEIRFETCDYCGRCGEVCEYHAIVVMKDKVLTFPELCHGCGACSMLCPQDAIMEKERPCGVIEQGTARGIAFFQGRLNIGEPMASPLIHAVKEVWKKQSKHNGITIIDVPPGTSCPVVESLKGSDFCVLVTEPTPFGLHDLKLAVQVLEKMEIPCGVVVNRAGIGDETVYHYCDESNIRILAEIPYKRDIAVLYSYGIPLLREGEEYRGLFRNLWREVCNCMVKKTEYLISGKDRLRTNNPERRE